MQAVELFAGVRVRDVKAARGWYERLLGEEPAFFPNEQEAVWALGEHRWFYLLEDAERAGRALVTIMVESLDAAVNGIAQRDIEPTEREDYDNGARKAIYHDDDGNEVGLAEVPAQ